MGAVDPTPVLALYLHAMHTLQHELNRYVPLLGVLLGVRIWSGFDLQGSRPQSLLVEGRGALLRAAACSDLSPHWGETRCHGPRSPERGALGLIGA